MYITLCQERVIYCGFLSDYFGMFYQSRTGSDSDTKISDQILYFKHCPILGLKPFNRIQCTPLIETTISYNGGKTDRQTGKQTDRLITDRDPLNQTNHSLYSFCTSFQSLSSPSLSAGILS